MRKCSAAFAILLLVVLMLAKSQAVQAANGAPQLGGTKDDVMWALGSGNNVATLSSATFKKGDVMQVNIFFDQSVYVMKAAIRFKLQDGDTDNNNNPYISVPCDSPNHNQTMTCKLTVDENTPSGKLLGGNLEGVVWDPETDIRNYINGGPGDLQAYAIDGWLGTLVTYQSNVVVDGSGPYVTQITSVSGDGAYKAGDLIDLAFLFNETIVWRDGAVHPPAVTLNSGRSGIDYVGSEQVGAQTKLKYRYSVNAGENAVKLDVLQLTDTGGWMMDAVGNSAPTNLLVKANALSAARNIRIDTAAPAITFGTNAGQSCPPPDPNPLFPGTSRGHVKIDASDGTGVGVSQIFYQWSTAQTGVIWIGSEPTLPAGGYNCVPTDAAMNGSYYFHAKAVDQLGNEATSHTGPLTVDNTPPSVTLSAESGAARRKHDVTVQVTDSLSAVAFPFTYRWINTDNGRETAGSSYTGNAIVTAPDEEGTYELEVTAGDTAGQWLTKKSAGRYIADKTPPTAEFHSAGNQTAAKAHQVTVTLTDAKGILGPASYAWSDRVDVQPADGSGWTQFYDGLGAPLTTFTSGTIGTPPNANDTWYLWLKVSDNPGAPSEERNMGYIVDTDGFLLDNTPPSGSFTIAGTGANYVKSVEAGFNASADVTAIKYAVTTSPTTDGNDADWTQATRQDKITLSSLTGTYYIHAKLYDAAGNSVLISSGAFLLDNAGPRGSAAAARTYTNQLRIDVVLDAVDRVDSEPESMAFRIDGGSWSGWVPYERSYNVSLTQPTEGNHTVAVKFADALGNESAEYSDTVMYDVTPPTATVSYSTTAWTNQLVTATIVPADNYTPAGQIEVTSAGAAGMSYVFQNNGEYVFTFRDLAGNTASVAAQTGNIDRQAPLIVLSASGNPKPGRSAMSRVTVTDDNTPPQDIRLFAKWMTDAVHAPADWMPVSADGTVETHEGDGNRYLWVKAVDAAGNEAVKTSSTFLLDNTPPVGTIVYSTTLRTAGPVTATLSIQDASGTTVTNPQDGSKQYTFTDNGSFTFQFEDEAGNKGTAVATVSNIDKSVPSAVVAMDPPFWTNQPMTVTVEVPGAPPRQLANFVITGEAKLVSCDTLERGTVTSAVYCGSIAGGTVTGSVYGSSVTGSVYGGSTVTGSVYSTTVTKAVFRFATNGELAYTVRDMETGLEYQANALIHQIDTKPPTGKLVYSKSGWTNEDVLVTVMFDSEDGQSPPSVTNNNGSRTYTFTDNGSFTFKLRDAAGNEGELTATVDFIDKTPPHPVVTYSENGWTARDVVASVAFDNEPGTVTLTNNNGSNRYTFSQNGEFTFTFRDAAGNTGQATVRVDTIDRDAPTGKLTYSSTGWTNQDVTVELSTEDPSGAPVQVINNGGSSRYTFTENGQFTFQFQDAAGNRGEMTAVVNRIDKQPPTANIAYSTTQPTSGRVRATLLANESVTVLNNNGETVYDFDQNGEFTFQLRDRAGNVASVTASVGNIDRKPPIPSLTYSTLEPTKDRVVVTVNADEPFVVLNNARNKQYVFETNGRFTFVVQDLAGNTAEIEAAVSNIDKSKPNVTLEYSESKMTSSDVTVTIQSDKPLTILNNGGSDKVVFRQNGIQWIEAKDALGNELTIKTEVTNIDRDKPDIRFLRGDLLLVPLGGQIEPLADVEAVDAVEGNVSAQLAVQHNINRDVAGDYTVTYSVTDAAGNTATVERKAKVVEASRLMLYVNSAGPNPDEVIVVGDTISLELFGMQGEVEAKWATGKLNKGAFKTIDTLVEGGRLTVAKSGYYTLLVQDQERQIRLVHVYVYHP
ncbi:Ig-like domain repeat protein [Paenibacillus allorhizosphaerae]|uniref:Pesticidal crystal protein Cry22Aa Ig-like domain-containing protein n=1 Tax=Paenibacillus allorhizosphaerae TaxID=2849866 RepID=A0ABM8VI86_9BACL|nr:Ig-like domain repeat protein [Paenibacillus allorhizosphaerae]CAG7643887.1 hypothetical protein PAECIP111802_03103 [Paenibacillus allorhizosphaerae]